MKVPFEKLDKAFENRLRLQIMSVLMENDRYDFNSLKELLDTTDGNLASHLKGLEKEGNQIVGDIKGKLNSSKIIKELKAEPNRFKKALSETENIQKIIINNNDNDYYISSKVKGKSY